MSIETTLVDASLFPRLIVRSGGRIIQEIELRGDLTIGRAEENDLQLTDPRASRHHARVHREESTYILSDLGSANGTRVNGILITGPHSLEHGDRISIGEAELTYQEPGRSAQDTLTMAAVPPTTVGQPSEGASRGLMIGLILAAAVVLLAIVAGIIYVLKPSFYEQIGLISTASPTAPAVAASPTSPAAVVTSAATQAATATAPPPATEAVDPEEMNDLLAQAEALTRRSKFEEATAIYEHLAGGVPDDARPEIGWAWALVLDDEAAEALPHAQRAVELDPTSSEAAAVLGRVYAALGETDQALMWGQKAVELDPGNAQAHAVLAEAYLLDGQIEQAVDEADLALVQDFNNADAHRIRGWLYLVADNDLGRAAGELQIAAGLQPELWLRRHELGLILLEAENYVTAIVAFQDALAIRPKAVTYTAIGEAYYLMGQYDQARASLQQALSAGADDAKTYGLLAATYARLGRCDDARTNYEQALEMEPSQPLALEAQELCQGAGPLPTSTLATTPGATREATPELTASPSAALSGHIAFPVWNAETGNYDVHIANVDGSGGRVVAEGMRQPALSPDGKWLALNGERTNYEHLVLVGSDGSGLREITEFLEDGQASWSPDGKKLAFGSTRHGDKQFRVYILDDVPFAGGKVGGRTLNFGPDDIRGQQPAWTSDAQVVFRGCDRGSPRGECSGTGLFVMSTGPDPQSPRQLTEHAGDTAPAAYGSKIAFMSTRDGAWEIYVINIDGSGLKRLTNSMANDGLPTWSPDGKTLAFVSDQDGAWAVWAMSPDGSNRRKLFPIGGGGLAVDWWDEQISWGR